MTKIEKIAACDILKYIKEQPQAKHTAQGIAKYWIYQQRMEENLDIVMAALEFLVQKGFLEEVHKNDGKSYFRANKKKITEIQAILETFHDDTRMA